MCTDEEKESLITFAGFGKKTGATASGSSVSDIALRKISAAAAVPAGSAAGELFIIVMLYLLLLCLLDCRTCMEQSSYQHHSINLFAIFQETT